MKKAKKTKPKIAKISIKATAKDQSIIAPDFPPANVSELSKARPEDIVITAQSGDTIQENTPQVTSEEPTAEAPKEKESEAIEMTDKNLITLCSTFHELVASGLKQIGWNFKKDKQDLANVSLANVIAKYDSKGLIAENAPEAALIMVYGSIVLDNVEIPPKEPQKDQKKDGSSA